MNQHRTRWGIVPKKKLKHTSLFSDERKLEVNFFHTRTMVSPMFSTIVSRGEWLWNPTNFFVVCFCSLFWPWPCTKHNNCLLHTEELTNRNGFLVTWFMHSVWAQSKSLCKVVDFPTLILASLFALLMFAEIPNHFPQLTMFQLVFSNRGRDNPVYTWIS